MSKWKNLDLRKLDSRPTPGRLLALRMVDRRGIYKAESYAIGKLEANPGGTKLWFRGSGGTPIGGRGKPTLDRGQQYDQSDRRAVLRDEQRRYLQGQYPEWDESELVYRKL